MNTTTQDRVVDAVHWHRRFAIDDRGVVGDITGFYDQDGDELPGLSGAVFAVVRWRDTSHLSRLDVANFEIIRTH